LVVDDVKKDPDVIEIGQRTTRIAQSILFGLGMIFILMAIASIGLIPPGIGAFR
jgi:hypothetical protein